MNSRLITSCNEREIDLGIEYLEATFSIIELVISSDGEHVFIVSCCEVRCEIHL